MALPYELLIGLRYTRAKKHNHFISFISLISMFGIALGVAALIVVLSVMNGFQTELRSRILAVVSHVEISGVGGELVDWPRVAAQAAAQPQVVAAAPFVQAQGMLAYGQAVRGAMVRGIQPDLEDQVADFRRHMKSGEFDALLPDRFNIILGSELARALGVFVGDRVTLIAPQGVVTPAGVVPRLKTFTVVGLFEVGMYEYDSGLALIHLADAQRLYRMDDRVTGVRLKLDDLFQAPRVARLLVGSLDTNAFISDWTRSHANFFRAVQIEKNMMFIILSLIVAVAAFNIVSTLVMAVTDKQRRHRHPAYARRQPGQHHGGVHRAGRADRLHRAGPRRRRRRGPGAQCRCRRAVHRTPARHAVPGQGGVLHFQPAFRPAVVET
jgi:lipoprotein-releasing system permease protein